MADKPIRRYEMTLTLGADDMESLLRTLGHLAFELDRRDGQDISITSGGYDAGYTLAIKFNPDATHESYFKQIEAWKTLRRIAAETLAEAVTSAAPAAPGDGSER